MATYEQKWNCCRRDWCETCHGVDYLHGPYWYAYWRPMVFDPGRAGRDDVEKQQLILQGEKSDWRGRPKQDRYKGPTESMYIGRDRWPELGTEPAGDPPPAAPFGWMNAPRVNYVGRPAAERAKAKYMRALIASRRLKAAPPPSQPRRSRRRNAGDVRALRDYWAA